MDIIVTVKQVPDPDIPPRHFQVDEAARKVIPPQGVAPVMNGYDANALEAALRLKDKHGGTVTVVTLGGDRARDTLKRGIAMGADAAIHINDPALLDADAFTTAQALAATVKKIGAFDLVLSGRQASDTDADQVQLGLPAVSPVQKVEEVADGSITVERIVEDGYQRVRSHLPGLPGMSSEANELRYPPLKGIMAAGRAQIPVWTAADLGVGAPERKVAGEQLAPTAQELASEGRRIADQLEQPLVAFLALQDATVDAASLGAYGVERVLVADQPAAEGPGGALVPVSPEWRVAAKIVVSGGRGLGAPDNRKAVDDLAAVLGAAVRASRAVTDAGWVPASHQVGLTGATVAPDLYIAIGISGAVQHVAGITGARTVVAINRDAEANIFKYARFGVVGDWKEILPAFTQRLSETPSER